MTFYDLNYEQNKFIGKLQFQIEHF